MKLFEFPILRWKLPFMHARELDDIAYESVIDENAGYDDFIATCKAVYQGAARTAEVTRYLVVLVMFCRAASEPADGWEAKMVAIFLWATGEAPTSKGKAGRLGAALRVSHFLFSHGEYMDAFVQHRYFSLNNVIDCPKPLLKDDQLLRRLLDQLSKSRHNTEQVAEAARHILHGQGNEKRDGRHHQNPVRAAPQPAVRSIRAVKEDGTYLVQLSDRSRCVSQTKEAIIAAPGGKAMLAAFHTAPVQKKARANDRVVVEVCGRRGKQHQALLEGNTARLWFSTSQLLRWKNGKAKVEEYDSLNPDVAQQEPPPTVFESKDLTYYIDSFSREPLTDPYTLRRGDHRESYNRSSWQQLLDGRRRCSPVLNAPIEFYSLEGLAVFLPQHDPALQAEVAQWLLTPEGQAYVTDVDLVDAGSFTDGRRDTSVGPAAGSESGGGPMVNEGVHSVTKPEAAVMVCVPPSHPSAGQPDDPIPSAAPIGSIAELRPRSIDAEDQVLTVAESTAEMLSRNAPVETLRLELERMKQQLKSTLTTRLVSARRRCNVRPSDPHVERTALMKQLGSAATAEMVDSVSRFLTDNVVAFFMETLNHHNHLLHLQDEHAYGFDPQVVTRAEATDGYGLRALDPIAAEAARYWLLPRNTPHRHWWLDVYDKFRHVLYRADSASMPHHKDPLPSALWLGDLPEIRSLEVAQQKDQVSCGDYVIQFALIIACPGWYPDSGALSRVLPWDRSELLSQLEGGGWETQRPEGRQADAVGISGVKRKLDYQETSTPQHDIAVDLFCQSHQTSPSSSCVSLDSPTSLASSAPTTPTLTSDCELNKRARSSTTQ